MNPRPPESPETGDEPPLAAEFVLGLVQGAEREALARRLRDDHVFAREVAFWEARLGPLAEDVEPVDVPAHVWSRIEGELGHRPVPLGARSASAPRAGLWNSLRFWRGLGLAASTLAAACLVLLLTAPPAPQPMVATLTLTDGRSAFMASVDRRTGRVMLMPAGDGTAPPPEHTHELWLIPAGGAPRSLGTFVATEPIMIDMPDAVMPHAGPDTMLAVSVEPMGGSPTGAPTGPMVAKGMMHDL